MSNFSYIAVDPHGSESRGTLEVADQAEALQRIRQMGLFPTKLAETRPGGVLTLARPPARGSSPADPRVPTRPVENRARPVWVFGRKIKVAQLTLFTRQLATLIEAGMPLLRGLRVLQEQEQSRRFKWIIGDLAAEIENGSTLAEALNTYPKVFSRLYVNMVRAGEIGGALDVTLGRLAEFMEKSQKIRGKVKAAMFYPLAVLSVATGVLVLLMTYVVPRFRGVFEGLLEGRPLPPFTMFVFRLSDALTHHLGFILIAAVMVVLAINLLVHTQTGRWAVDKLKLGLPVVGPLFRKLAISRFTRNLGTLISNGVPILQALTIVKETAGNLVVARLIGVVHENVKQGEPIAPTLKGSQLFPPMVSGMVDVGEQTGALPEMLMKVANNYDDEVDNATNALTSLLEPVLLVFLAVLVGSIVIAMFLPLIYVVSEGIPTGPREE